MNKIHKIANGVHNLDTIAELNKVSNKPENPKNGFWAIITVEYPEGDSDGDIITVKGITADFDPANGKYLPLLAAHNITLANGDPPEIGRIEALVDTEVDGIPAKAMYFTFALDENDQPIDDLTAKYYKRYTKGYTNSFSVGMNALDEGEKLSTGGRKYNSTQLFEVSCVSIGANKGALGITRVQDDDMDMTALRAAMKEDMAECFKAAFAPFEARMDLLESYLVTQDDSDDKPVPDKAQPEALEEPKAAEELEQVKLAQELDILNAIQSANLNIQK